jgi:hypothetical protein
MVYVLDPLSELEIIYPGVYKLYSKVSDDTISKLKKNSVLKDDYKSITTRLSDGSIIADDDVSKAIVADLIISTAGKSCSCKCHVIFM